MYYSALSIHSAQVIVDSLSIRYLKMESLNRIIFMYDKILSLVYILLPFNVLFIINKYPHLYIQGSIL